MIRSSNNNKRANKSMKMLMNVLYILEVMFLFSMVGCGLFESEKYETSDAEGVLVINEFLARNDANFTDENGDFDDWVELFNTTQESIDVGGMYVTDNPEDANPYRIPRSNPELTTILPEGYLILWFDRESEEGPHHVEVQLSAEGESIVLIGKDETTIIDSYTFGPQEADISTGRRFDGSDEWITFTVPTPGESNN
jgi:hypothetical protein